MDARVVLLVLTGPRLDYDTETKPLVLSPDLNGGGGSNSYFIVSNKIENKNSLLVLFRTKYRKHNLLALVVSNRIQKAMRFSNRIRKTNF